MNTEIDSLPLDEQLIHASTVPKVDALISEFTRCTPYSYDGYNRATDNDDIRYNRWPNQSVDGKKHGTDQKPAKPWENASDTLVYTADDIIDEQAAVLENAFWRATAAVTSAQKSDDQSLTNAGNENKLLHWILKNKQAADLVTEVELSAQHMLTYGWVVLKIVWEQDLQLKRYEVRMDQFQQLAQSFPPGSPLAALPALMADPAMDDETVPLLDELYQAFVRQQSGEIFTGDEPAPALKGATARRVLKELRETGKSSLPMPYLCKNQPNIIALQPWLDIFMPPGTTDIQRARVVFHRDWLTEIEMRENILTEGWDKDWVEAAVKKKGQFSQWVGPNDYTQDIAANMRFAVAPVRTDLIEILYCYCRQVDDDGIPGIYETVIQPALSTLDNNKPAYGKHQLLPYAHGKMPFALGTRERPKREIERSRGIPQIVRSAQREEKVQRDATIDRTSFSVLPPILTPIASGAMQTQYKFGPGALVPIRPGAKPEAFELGGTPVDAMSVINLLRLWVDSRFGRVTVDTPPTLSQIKQQKVTNKFLSMWTEALTQEMQLILQYTSDDKFQKITGQQKPQVSFDDMAELYNFALNFDVRELDAEHIAKKLEAVKNILMQIDRGGVIDATKVVKMGLRLIDPAFVDELMMDQTSASKLLYDSVQKDIALMALGNEVNYSQDVDPTAQRQLEYAQQIIFGDPSSGQGGNPKYLAKLGKAQDGETRPDPRFAELLDNWVKNKQQSITQQRNQVIGRTGVKPVGMAA